MVSTHKEYTLSKQVLRSGTSVGANIREGYNGESDADFIHKFAIAQKECDEICCWLELLLATEYITQSEFISIHTEASEILSIIKTTIVSKRRNMIAKKIKTICSFLFFQ